jgi:ferredoxin-type protein NapH
LLKPSPKTMKTLHDNRYRYLAMVGGFFLLVAPFALLTRGIYLAIGNVATPDLHTICYRMPVDWIFGGRIYMIFSSLSMTLLIGIVAITVFSGPLFCGWLCPLGAVSEGVSRVTPIKDKYRIKIKDPKITAGLRYGFFVGFVAIAILVGYKLAADSFSSICCRYCNASVMQNMVSAVFGNPDAISYWHTGGILALGTWLVVGGVMMSGGRGWCMFFCPLGALNGLAHKGGAKLGFYRTDFDKSKCKDCASCQVKCPMWAIKSDRSVERTLCNNCNECTHSCIGGAYKYKRGKNAG